MAYSDLRKIAFVGDYLPRKCGIATFTHDLRHAVDQCATAECLIVPVDDIEGGYEYPSEVRFQLSEQDLDSYRRAADFLNFSNVDVVSLQHEFGIYGGPGGGHILAFLRDLRIPTVTTLHTAGRYFLPNTKSPNTRSTSLCMASRTGRSPIPTSTKINSASRESTWD